MHDIYLGKNWRKIGILWPILLHLCITLPLASVLNIWVDEAYTLNTTDHGVIFAVTQSLTFENQPPLYFGLLSGWRLLNDSILFARGFSILSTVLAIATCYPLSRRYLPEWPPWLLPMLVAFHPYTIWAAVEIRVYGLTIWLSALLLLFFFDGYLSKTVSPKGKGWYLLVVVLTLMSHYGFFCLLIAQTVSLWGHSTRKQSLYHLLTLTFAGLCAFPTLLTVLSHRVVIPMRSAGRLEEWVLSLKAVLGRVSSDLIPLTNFSNEIPTRNLDGLKILRYFCLGILILIMLYNRLKLTTVQRQLTMMLCADVVVMSIVLMLTHTTVQGFRYGFHLFLMTLLWAGAILSTTSSWMSLKALRRVLVGGLVSIYVLSLSLTYAPLAKDGDWRRVTAYLHQMERVNQPIFLFTGEGELPLARYYKGINPLIALPNPMGEETFDIRKLVIEDEQSLYDLLIRDNPVETFWLITSPSFVIDGLQTGQCELYNINLNCQILNQFLAQYYQIEVEKSFWRSHVAKLKLKATVMDQATPIN